MRINELKMRGFYAKGVSLEPRELAFMLVAAVVIVLAVAITHSLGSMPLRGAIKDSAAADRAHHDPVLAR
jgi:hypothetical protein